MKQDTSSRREFLKTSSAAVAGAVIAAPYILSAAEKSDTIKVGLIGCGGRGSGAASQALMSDKYVVLTAMGDAFQDQLNTGYQSLKASKEFGDRVQVNPDHKFVGLDAYKQVIESGVDVVLLATPPGFRPLHMKYAVENNKHVFAEKPIATDAVGYRSFMESVKLAKQKNLAVGSGFCWRSHLAQRAAYEKVLAGEIGQVMSVYGTYNTSPPRTPIPRDPKWSDMEYVIRNWMQFSWLSGDHLVEQAVHNVDLMNWAFGNQMPVKAIGHGGRQIRPEPLVGNNYDHFAVTYEWATGARGFIFCRQQTGCANDNTETIFGTKGKAHIMLFKGDPYITDLNGERTWKYAGPKPNMYQVEHDELFASIRAGKPRNDGEWLANSSMMAIMGRMAAYTGQEVTWEQAVASKESLVPERITWDALPPAAPLPMPGRTAFA
ncbi:MAG: Gfo/Idh/MocA family oxidoreductase [Opitutaceae bacterium]|nr:Gfo/Idh/MocA family oxidoreductase [Verrucomicrobiales bacterium]